VLGLFQHWFVRNPRQGGGVENDWSGENVGQKVGETRGSTEQKSNIECQWGRTTRLDECRCKGGDTTHRRPCET